MPVDKSPTAASATTTSAESGTGQIPSTVNENNSERAALIPDLRPQQPNEHYKDYMLRLSKQEGINWRGRIGQRELAREMMRSSVLLYPGPHDFCETFCITALESQAAGCVPVTRDNGALPETNAHGIVLPNASDTEKWVTAIQEARSRTEDERTTMRLWAMTKTWREVANRILTWAIAAEKAADPPAPAVMAEGPA